MGNEVPNKAIHELEKTMKFIKRIDDDVYGEAKLMQSKSNQSYYAIKTKVDVDELSTLKFIK